MKNPARILVLEDDAPLREILVSVLQDEGLEVEAVARGEEAVAICSRKLFDLVILDVMMPKMDGYTLSKEIKKIHRFKHIPIIALTSKNTKDDRLRGIESGINEYLTKPCTQEYLIKIIRQHIHLPQHLIQS